MICPHCGSGDVDKGVTGLDMCQACGGLSREGKTLRDHLRPTFVDNAKLWGSDCVACGNATAGSQICDNCGLDVYTVPLYYDEMAYAEKLALAERDKG